MQMKHYFGAAVLGLSMLLGSTASAATLNFLGDVVKGKGSAPDTYDATIIRDVLTCSLGCEGLNSSAVSGPAANMPSTTGTPTWTGFVGTHSDLFASASSSDAAELTWVNLVTGGAFASGFKTDGGGASAAAFVSSALYILFKIGSDPNVTIVKNTGGLANSFTFASIPGLGSGLSHYTEFGRADGGGGGGGGGGVVPLPASLPLLLGGLGVMGFIARRRAKKA